MAKDGVLELELRHAPAPREHSHEADEYKVDERCQDAVMLPTSVNQSGTEFWSPTRSRRSAQVAKYSLTHPGLRMLPEQVREKPLPTVEVEPVAADGAPNFHCDLLSVAPVGGGEDGRESPPCRDACPIPAVKNRATKGPGQGSKMSCL